MAQQRLLGGADQLINRNVSTPQNRNEEYIAWSYETPDRSFPSAGSRPYRWPALNVNTLTDPNHGPIVARQENYHDPEAWIRAFSALVPPASLLPPSLPQRPFSPLRSDDPTSQYRTAVSSHYHRYSSPSSLSIPDSSAHSRPPPIPLERPPASNPQVGIFTEKNVDEAQKLLDLIFHKIKKVWVDDWIKKGKQEIEKGQNPKDNLEEAINSIRESSDNLPKSFSRDALGNLQDLLDKIKPEGGTAFKVLKECLINYAGNSIEHITQVVQNLLDLLNKGKKFLGHYRGTDSYPPPRLFNQYVLVYTTTAPKLKRKARARSEETEESGGASLGYKTSPCDNVKCQYCLQEQTNGQTGLWRTRQDAITCLISSLLSQENLWICPAW
jgi:hypothetical protein